jgi:hypothetical protein
MDRRSAGNVPLTLPQQQRPTIRDAVADVFQDGSRTTKIASCLVLPAFARSMDFV